jgi:hypothetical protein
MTMLPFLQQAFVFRLSTFGGAYHYSERGFMEPLIGIEPMTSSLPWLI